MSDLARQLTSSAATRFGRKSSGGTVCTRKWVAAGQKLHRDRISLEAMALACVEAVPPLTMFKAIWMQMDELGLELDFRVNTLADLSELVISGVRASR